MKVSEGNSAGFIEVALTSFDDRDVNDRAEWLDEIETAKLNQFVREIDRRRFVASRVLLRETLARATGISPAKWRFSLQETGQWQVAENAELPQVNFSTSHCGEAVAVAVSDLYPVGIDFEPLAPGSLKFPVDTVLNDAELERLEGLAPREREREVLKLWTVKEALAKLVGLGTDLDFASFEVSLSPLRLVRAGSDIPDSEFIRLTSQECQISRVPYQVSLAFRIDPSQSLRIGTQVLESTMQEE